MSINDQLLLNEYNKTILHSQANRKIQEEENLSRKARYESKDSNDFLVPSVFQNKTYIGFQSDYSDNKNISSFRDQFKKMDINKPTTMQPSSLNEACNISSFNVFDEKKTDFTFSNISQDDPEFTKNFKSFNTSSRDIGFKITDDNENTRLLELYTGQMPELMHKKEQKGYEPEQNKFYDHGEIQSEILERAGDSVSKNQNYSLPFQQKRVGPGLGLAYDDPGLNGAHDTTRLLPPDIDSTRRKGKEQISYEGDVQHGQKPNKRQVSQPFEVRKNHIITDGYQGHKTGVKMQKSSDNINIEINNRMFSQPVIGPAGSSMTTKFNPESSGKVKKSKRKIEHFSRINNSNIGSKGVGDYLSNVKVSETQRYYMDLGKNRIGNIKSLGGTNMINYDEQIHGKQELDSYIYTGANKRMGQKVSNYDEQIHGKQELDSYIYTGANRNIGQKTYIEQDARPTHKETLVNHSRTGNIAGKNKQFVGMLDEARQTQKQSLVNQTRVGNINNSHGKLGGNLTKKVDNKITLKDLLLYNRVNNVNSSHTMNSNKIIGKDWYQNVTNRQTLINHSRTGNVAGKEQQTVHNENIDLNNKKYSIGYAPVPKKGIAMFNENQVGNMSLKEPILIKDYYKSPGYNLQPNHFSQSHKIKELPSSGDRINKYREDTLDGNPFYIDSRGIEQDYIYIK